MSWHVTLRIYVLHMILQRPASCTTLPSHCVSYRLALCILSFSVLMAACRESSKRW